MKYQQFGSEADTSPEASTTKNLSKSTMSGKGTGAHGSPDSEDNTDDKRYWKKKMYIRAKSSPETSGSASDSP